MEALRESWSITLLSWEPADVEAINSHFGTSLRLDDFETQLAGRLWRGLFSLLPFPLALWKRAVLMRAARGLAPEFDVVLSVNNELDVGRRGIQYIHFPWGYWPRPKEDLRWYHRWAPLLRLYYLLADGICPVSRERVAKNLTLVNSEWTGEAFRRWYGGTTLTLYPPVAIESETRPWEERRNGFLCLGRLSAGKRVEVVIEILRDLRRLGHDVRLHLVGTSYRQRYSRRILREVEREEWISFHENLDRADLARLAGENRYGIHGMEQEHFGMAPAELAAAGCIVFVPNGGGQVEIVGGDERLLFRTPDEAVAKIDRVLRSPELQAEFRAQLAPARERFSSTRFENQARDLLRDFSANDA